MFEAKFAQAAVLKKLLESIKDLVTDANWDCAEYDCDRYRYFSLFGALKNDRYSAKSYPRVVRTG